MADHDALQAQFVELTGADAATAHFYLESAGWKLETATATFFDNAGGLSSPVAAPPAAKPAPPQAAPAPHAQPHANPSGHGAMPTGKPAGHKRPPNARSSGPRVKTFGEIRSPDSDEEEEEEKEQSYYAGGAASGQVVKSGSRKPAANPSDIVKDVFESAKSHGAEVVDPHEHGGKEEKAKPFVGAGFRLGTSMAPSMPDPATIKKPAAEAPKDRLVVITFWRSGFSVDDGPLRRFDDPANKAFLDDVHGGVIPRELHALAQGAQLNVNLVDKSHEDYVAPKPVLKPFAGSGQKLGNAASAPPAAAAPAAATSSAAPVAPPVDASQPSTTLQIRLADGTLLRAKFNVTATVAQLRSFIDAARVGSKNYQLQTPMPVVVLSDPSKTLKELGLLNATVIQKML